MRKLVFKAAQLPKPKPPPPPTTTTTTAAARVRPGPQAEHRSTSFRWTKPPTHVTVDAGICEGNTMITKFDSSYYGTVDMENLGYAGTPIN